MLRKKRVFVGIYSSACETIARAEDEHGNLIGKSSLQDTINIHISIKHSWDIIKNVVSKALRDAHIQIDDPNVEINVGMGIKNTELVEACIELKKLNNIFKTFIIDADGSVLLRGSHKNDGAVIILDYGVVGNALTSNKLIKIGGWGFPHADKGSIPWIGLEAMQLTIQWLDGFIAETPVLTEIYRYFDNDMSKLVKWAMYSRTDPKEYNFICDIVLDCLAKQDPYSLTLINSTALEANKLYEKLLEKSGTSSMPCSLYGQLVPHVSKFISGSLAINITTPFGDGTDGAIALVRSEAGKGQVNDYMPSHSLKQRLNAKYTFTG
jgi:glucosamine kinase